MHLLLVRRAACGLQPATTLPPPPRLTTLVILVKSYPLASCSVVPLTSAFQPRRTDRSNAHDKPKFYDCDDDSINYYYHPPY